jgi:tetratricopeptide (TPR) repeat protein
MGIWKKLLGQDQDAVDYYEEGVALLGSGKYHEALTSLRLALRDTPDDLAVLQQMAIVYTRIGMSDEAMRTYRKVLAIDEHAAGAHYGLAFLLLRDGKPDDAKEHLRTFLAEPPDGPEAARHIEHAKSTLDSLEAGGDTAKGAIP